MLNLLFGVFFGMAIFQILTGVSQTLLPFVLMTFRGEFTLFNLRNRLELQLNMFASLYTCSWAVVILGTLGHAAFCEIFPWVAYYEPLFVYFYLLSASLFTSAQNVLMVTLLEVLTILYSSRTLVVTIKKIIHIYAFVGPVTYCLIAFFFITYEDDEFMTLYKYFSIQYGLESSFALVFSLWAYHRLNTQPQQAYFHSVKNLVLSIFLSSLVGLLSTVLNLIQNIAGIYIPNAAWCFHDFLQVWSMMSLLIRPKNRSLLLNNSSSCVIA